MRDHPCKRGDSRQSSAWLQEVRVTFDRDELESFFDGFSPLDSPAEMIERLWEHDTDEGLPFAA